MKAGRVYKAEGRSQKAEVEKGYVFLRRRERGVLAHPKTGAPTKDLKMRGSRWPVRGKLAAGAILPF
jgi:hypothetical protein